MLERTNMSPASGTTSAFPEKSATQAANDGEPIPIT